MTVLTVVFKNRYLPNHGFGVPTVKMGMKLVSAASILGGSTGSGLCVSSSSLDCIPHSFGGKIYINCPTKSRLMDELLPRGSYYDVGQNLPGDLCPNILTTKKR